MESGKKIKQSLLAGLFVCVFIMTGLTPQVFAQKAATIYAPDAVKTLLMAFHGTSVGALDAASTRVPEILRGLVADPAAEMILRRQAAGALAHYPTAENLSFIETQVSTSSVVMQRVFLGTLRYYSSLHPQAVARIVSAQLENPDLTVRYSAAGAAGTMTGSSELKQALQARILVEADERLKTSLKKLLSRY